MKRKIRSALVDILTNTVGRTLVLLRPKKVDELSKKGMTLVWEDNLTSTERLMRRFILRKMEKNQDYDALAKLHQTYWAEQGDDFVNRTENNLENTHLPGYKSILNTLENQIAKEALKFNKLVEIGTGNGSVLDYLSHRLPEVDHMIGIDLSKGQTDVNTSNYGTNSKLEFLAADVLEWIEEQDQENVVFLTFRGVLEYFTQQQLVQFFRKLNSMGNVMFFAIEPNGHDHNWEMNPNSQIYGVESSFSHNYIKLFKDAGFKIWHHEQKKESGQLNHMTVVGAKNF
ncbi:class I SAM-dependent methyltransferase [Winogradskyella sp. R77965]|uniref:class I SAM-dependent methyltransferase n=1 Tax=Winogradskyella sp. R77965 TaxID=3093872 RepID=UPI0037DD0B65